MTNRRRVVFVAVNEFGFRIGQYHPNAKLSDDQIDQIRDMREEQNMRYTDIAAIVGLSKGAIAKICRYERRAQTPERWKKIVKDDDASSDGQTT